MKRLIQRVLTFLNLPIFTLDDLHREWLLGYELGLKNRSWKRSKNGRFAKRK